MDLEETALEDATDLNLAFSNKGTISSSAIKEVNPISKCYENSLGNQGTHSNTCVDSGCAVQLPEFTECLCVL